MAERAETRDGQFLIAAGVLSRHLGIHGKITGEIRPGEVNVAVIEQPVVDKQSVIDKCQRFLESVGATVSWPTQEIT